MKPSLDETADMSTHSNEFTSKLDIINKVEATQFHLDTRRDIFYNLHTGCLCLNIFCEHFLSIQYNTIQNPFIAIGYILVTTDI